MIAIDWIAASKNMGATGAHVFSSPMPDALLYFLTPNADGDYFEAFEIASSGNFHTKPSRPRAKSSASCL